LELFCFEITCVRKEQTRSYNKDLWLRSKAKRRSKIGLKRFQVEFGWCLLVFWLLQVYEDMILVHMHMGALHRREAGRHGLTVIGKKCLRRCGVVL